MTKIKERVLQVSDYYKVKKEKFFEELKLSYANFKGIQKNSALSSDAIDIILSKYPNISAEWLVTGRGSMLKENLLYHPSSSTENRVADPAMNVFKLKTDQIMMKQAVPLYDIQASASIVSLFRDSNSEKPVDHISIPNLPKCDGAIYVSGDSMYPLLKSGDIIMYKKLSSSIDNIFWGEMYLVSLVNDDGDEFVMVKWVQKSEKGENYIKLVSENRHHQPKDFHLKNIKGLALIKASVRVNSMY
ncbi:peptidase S24 [Flavobacterium sp. GA093]|uniref:Peptidase S24 n=1 Tax=Flavobacterium hydrocarbonoxydans TaxID=2683249 RepID=A0A6I4NR83_9FLAO|nr:S24 family peptidase [Flavobacterium hydrocarbonoxydans]MWB96740.1 peptidase S24 [Flavobacterium hydrocarbonoxydans]